MGKHYTFINFSNKFLFVKTERIYLCLMWCELIRGRFTDRHEIWNISTPGHALTPQKFLTIRFLDTNEPAPTIEW